VTGSTKVETSESAGLEELKALRARMLPMFEAVAQEYASRVEPGYPIVFDSVEEGGYFGIHLDPGYGLYIMTDGESVFAQITSSVGVPMSDPAPARRSLRRFPSRESGRSAAG